MSGVNINDITQNILEGLESEGFINVGYLDKLARGIAKGIYKSLNNDPFHKCPAVDTFTLVDLPYILKPKP